MVEKIRNVTKLINFDIIRLPKNVKSFARRIIMIAILGSLIPDLFSFTLKGSQVSLKSGRILLAIVLLLIHFSQRILLCLFGTFEDLQNDSFEQIKVNESTRIVMNVSNITKSKVFKAKGKIIQMVEQPEIIKITKDYLGDYWDLYIRFPVTIAQVLILLGMLIASIWIEFSSSTLAETIIITSLLISCIVVYFFLSKKRINVMRSYRKNRKENEVATDVLFTEIKSTDFISQNDFLYHADKLRSKLDENVMINKSERLKLNKIFIQRSFVASTLMIVIMVVKFITSGKFTIDTFVDVVALSSIYSTMLQRITSITSNYENIMNVVIDLETLNPDFTDINDVFVAEQKRLLVTTPIESLTVSEFAVTQDLNGAFELINDHVFTINSGDTAIAYGRTGCGKSTLINLFTGKMTLTDSPITFSNGKNGYLNSIGYQTDRAMVNNYVLNEITLSDDFGILDRDKFFEIIRGLRLYDEILRMVKEENLEFDNLTDDGKIIEFLKIRKTREFSSGQKQRLALAKLLYSLDDSIQLVALDEPFNRLDNRTCSECMAFVHEYVHRRPRILLIATHQVEICQKYSNIEISFDENLKKSTMIVKTN